MIFFPSRSFRGLWTGATTWPRSRSSSGSLRGEEMFTHRESSKPPSCHRPKEHVATGPNQVCS